MPTSPVTPETKMVDGYGEAAPLSGITITSLEANDVTFGSVKVKLTVLETSPLNCSVTTIAPPLVPLAVKLNGLGTETALGKIAP